MDSKTKIFASTVRNFCYSVVVLFLVLGSNSLTCNAEQSDIDCLKSLKRSLADPFGYLASWNFNNQTAGFICNFKGVECWHPDENKVLSIRLPSMGLGGEFPRGLQKCTALNSLDLSKNQLYGTIPSNIKTLIGYVVALDLSSNQFSGSIPVDVANCSNLNYLKLDNNNLEGQIPLEIGLLPRLQTFNVANNELTGPVPMFVSATIPAESYADNPGLCGSPMEACRLSKSNHTVLFISGFMTGWSIFTLLGIYLFSFGFPGVKKIVLLIKKRRKAVVIDGSEWPEGLEVNNDPERCCFPPISKLEKFVTRMSYRELAKATSNFSQDNEIGKGMLGKVYKALVPNGWTVAIKRLNSSENLEDEFVSEITTLGSLRHQNLVPLVGFCSERDERLLVYKYMPNGCLHEWLHSTDDKARLLDFPLRIKIAAGVAKALTWLHYDGNFQVVHSNISTQCILLDEKFDPKISNFWEATVAKPNEIESGLSIMPTVESLDFTSYKKDVYRFGVVLLELLTRKESYQLNCSSINFSSSSFASPLDVDKVLLGQGYDAMVLQLLELASNCMKFIPDQRPTMKDVCRSVAEIAQIHDQTRNPEIQLHVD